MLAALCWRCRALRTAPAQRAHTRVHSRRDAMHVPHRGFHLSTVVTRAQRRPAPPPYLAVYRARHARSAVLAVSSAPHRTCTACAHACTLSARCHARAAPRFPPVDRRDSRAAAPGTSTVPRGVPSPTCSQRCAGGVERSAPHLHSVRTRVYTLGAMPCTCRTAVSTCR